MHESELRGSYIYLHIVKKLPEIFSFNSARVCALGWPLLGFGGDFSKMFLRGVCEANHLLGIYSISGLKYFL